MATIAPARALGRESELGALAVGQRADLIELAPGSLELRRVWVGGHMLEPAQGAG
jgi:cytosine/adenosine deaminase-related metal-dependent hydrolase